MPFDVRTATAAELLERADYLDRFPASGRYRDDLSSEAIALRNLAKMTEASRYAMPGRH